ncbi:MAG: hypothetical protein SFX73_09215 [Kofleriaceae bacterium]|nr:hypothetical protein [Kofleriaceae bacterium]
MGRLGRFLKLERARPDDAPATDADARASLRFRAIEPRKDEPTGAHDRFAPLEIAHHAPEADRAKEERRARAEAELAELARERQELAVAEPQRAPAWMQRPGVHALARMTITSRMIALGTSALVIGILAQIVGPVAWGLLPIVAAVVIGSHYLHST